MTGEEHLEEAARSVKKYMDESECGFCQRKAESINRAIIGLKDLTAEAQELAAKIKAKKELSAMGKPEHAPVQAPSAPQVSPQIERARARVALMREAPVPPEPTPAPKVTYHPPTKTETAKATVIPAKNPVLSDGLGFRELIRGRPRLKDVIYTGD